MSKGTEIVSFKKDGKRIFGRLVLKLEKSAVVKPYIWLKREAIQINIKKACMRFTGRTI